MPLLNELETNTLEEARKTLGDKQFIPLGSGDEWVVYIPTDHIGEDMLNLRNQVLSITDVFDPQYKPLVRLLVASCKTEISSADSNVVYKVASVQMAEGKEIRLYTKEELEFLLIEKLTIL